MNEEEQKELRLRQLRLKLSELHKEIYETIGQATNFAKRFHNRERLLKECVYNLRAHSAEAEIFKEILGDRLLGPKDTVEPLPHTRTMWAKAELSKLAEAIDRLDYLVTMLREDVELYTSDAQGVTLDLLPEDEEERQI